MIGISQMQVFTKGFSHKLFNNTETQFSVGLTYRGACPGKYKTRCRFQPINTGVKFVRGPQVQQVPANRVLLTKSV
jgi:hypothetical protein